MSAPVLSSPSQLIHLDPQGASTHNGRDRRTQSMKSSLYPLVQGLDIFRRLQESEVCEILAETRMRKVSEGGTVFTQGAPALRFFLLVTGRLKVLQLLPDGTQIIAHLIAPGQLFGCAIAVGRRDYPGTAVALVDSTLLVWPVTAWDKLALRHPAIVQAALQMIGGHLQDAFARLREVSSVRVEQRVARALLRLLRQAGRRSEEGIQIEFPITRRDIAEMTSTTLHTVSRTLSAWEQAGVLAGRRRQIVILDPHALVRIAGED